MQALTPTIESPSTTAELVNRETPTIDYIQDALETAQRNITDLQNHFGSPAVFGMSIEKTQSVISLTETQLKCAIILLQQLKPQADALELLLKHAYGESP